MKLHANAATCPNSRALIARRVLDERWSLRSAAEAAGVSEPTARKWVRRAAAGEPLNDRSSAPAHIPHRTPERQVEAMRALRRLRMTAAEIAELLGLALSTVSLWLKRIGLGKRSRLAPPEPPNRYERRRPGELVHVDIKKLGRILAAGHRVTGSKRLQRSRRVGGVKRGVAGWEFVHVCIDDHSRLAYAEVLASEDSATAIGFLRRAIAWFGERGVAVERVMTDNGSAYVSRAPTPRPAAGSVCGTCGPGPTARARTARPSASSRRCCASGPTDGSTEPLPSAPCSCGLGSRTTTSDDLTAPSATNRQVHE
jgi:transposase